MNRVVPNIVTDGCKDHIAWIEKALDGKVKNKYAVGKDQDIIMHAVIEVLGADIYVNDPAPLWLPPSAPEAEGAGEKGEESKESAEASQPNKRQKVDRLGGPQTQVNLNCPDVETAQRLWDQCIKEGAVPVMDMKAQFWGMHYGILEDPKGVQWNIGAQLPGPKKDADAEAENSAEKPEEGSKAE